jgi:PAS domain S-box-containing protein
MGNRKEPKGKNAKTLDPPRKKKAGFVPFEELRRRAEAPLGQKRKNGQSVSVEDITALVHELEVQQIELEMQNEELRRAQAELEASRSKFSDLYDFAPVGYFTLDEQGIILEANLTGANLLGLERSHLPKKPFLGFVSPQDRHPFHVHLKVVMKTGTKRTCELGLLKKDGTPFYAQLESIAVQDKAGACCQIRTAVLDVTDRRRAEQACRLNEQHYRDLYDNAPYAYFSVSAADGSILKCNAAASRLVGYDKKTLTGMKVFNLYAATPEGKAKALQVFKHFKEGASTRDVELEMQHKDGHSVWISLSVEPVKDRAGNITESRSAVIDITERKRAEETIRKTRDELEQRVQKRTAELGLTNVQLQQEIEEHHLTNAALRESEMRYRTLFEGAPMGINLTSAEGHILAFNQRLLQIVGYSAEEWAKMNVKDVYDHPEDRERLLKQVQEEGIVRGFEVKMKRKSGALFHASLTLCMIALGGRDVLLTVINDVSDRKEVEEALQRSEDALRRLSAQLLSIQEGERKRISRELHDSIGQSLAAIKFGMENALSKMHHGTAEASAELLKAIIPLVQQTSEEVRQIHTDLRPSLLDDLGIIATISWFCREFEQLYSHIRIEKQIEVQEQDVPEPLKIVMFRIMQEAMNNVGKYGKADVARLALKKTRGRLRLTIADNGQGFDPADMRSVKREKAGVGLVSMKERTEFSGGSFSIDSKKGKGTTVRVSWPMK